MSKTLCSTVQRQLDEMMLGEPQSPGISRHLSECSACRDFNEKQTKLRQIVGSLDSVSAPSDFDFRLRAKLANSESSGNYQRNRNFLLIGQRIAAFAAAVVMIVGGIFLAREFRHQNTTTDITTDNRQHSGPVPTAVDIPYKGKHETPGVTEATARVTSGKENGKVSRRSQPTQLRNIRTIDSRDQASSVAPLIHASQTSDQVFPIDASQQSLKVSLFDARGNPRIISLPTVTFGSQRVVPTATSFAPKGVW
jgi:hypothetical protein